VSSLIGILQLIRPSQWSKNAVVFAAILFSPARVVMQNPAVILTTIQGFLVFCLLSGAVYSFNDLFDLDADRHHPKKKHRPLASGKVSKSTAWMVAISCSVAGVYWAFAVNAYFGWIAAAYLATNIVYTIGLKHVVILDVLLLSAGFVYRAVGGVALIRPYLNQVYFSYWLVLCAFLLSLFLALAKRRHEIAMLGDAAAAHRASLANYSLTFIDQMLATLAGATIVAYSLYTISDETVAHYGTRNLFWTLPFVVYGLFRYLYLIYHRSEGGDPSSLLVRDRATLATVVLWGLVSASIVYFR
jgi:4-hydroxybenzoate polyprenyltransferase